MRSTLVRVYVFGTDLLMKASIKMEKYADWGQYKEWGAENIEGMHRMLTQ